jgi:solute carrier family 35 protein
MHLIYIGYFLILANDLCTAMYGVAIRYTLANSKVQISQNTLLVYNSALGAVALGLFMTLVSPDELRSCVEFEQWSDPTFTACFALAAGCGCVLNYAIFLCTQKNSALTTTVIGCMKNVVTSYAGMFIGGDYIFSWPNFVGLNVSIAGSLVYSFFTFKG